jgi:heavy metal sensor kinase
VSLARLPIRVRLTVAFAAAMAVVLALTGLFVYARVERNLNDAIAETLDHRANDMEVLIRRGESLLGTPSGAPLPSTQDTFAQILTASGAVLRTGRRIRSSTLTPAEVASASGGEKLLPERRVFGIEGEAKLLARPFMAGEERLIVVVGVSTLDRPEALAGLLRAFAIGGPLALLLAAGAGYTLAARALGPVDAMRRRADQIHFEELHERLPLPPADDEVRRLGVTLNAMLARLEEAFERERTFVSDASHELRTPLAILKTELELALRSGRSDQELRAALHSAAEETDRLAQLAEDLLVIARAEQGQLPVAREEVVVSEVLERAGRRFAGRAEQAGRRIVVDAPPDLRAPLDSMRIEQAVGNLVDNALRYGAGDVRLSASRSDGQLELTVSDAGGGFPEGFAEYAFERFTRVDVARSRGGAGLGLSIVRAIAEAHGGVATADESAANGGARVRLTLPTAV